MPGLTGELVLQWLFVALFSGVVAAAWIGVYMLFRVIRWEWCGR